MAMNTKANIKVLMKLKVLVKKLRKSNIVAHEGIKKGHFAVVAGQGEETTRFTLELEYLKDPDFVKLLEQAEEEYGFQQQGVLAVPCRPQELQNILAGRRRSRR